MSDLSAGLHMQSPAVAAEPSPGAQGSVLHLVARITDTVFSFLGPATTALAEQGVRQTVVLVDDPRYRHLLARFDPSVQLVLINGDMPLFKRRVALLAAYADTVRAISPTAAHLHGVSCLMLGLYAARAQKLSVPTYFTPHGSRTFVPLRLLWNLLTWVMRPALAHPGDRVIASSGAEARQMTDPRNSPVHLVESPVGTAFFDDEHAPGPAPRIVTGQRGSSPLGAARFAQCAVLLADEVPGLRFNWIGTAENESTERLKAAGITLTDLDDDQLRARDMATAWVFVAPEGAPGFPLYLAQAMALGLPCVAWDAPNHRDIIEHGVTGFLCRNIDDALDHLAQLLESAALRKRIGEAARAVARARFDHRIFSATLLGIYGMPAAQ